MAQAQEVAGTGVGTSAPVPKCTLTAGSRTVPLKRSKGEERPPGTLTMSARCTQKISARLTGTVTVLAETKPRHGKRKSRAYAFHAVRASLAAGKVKGVAVKLPAAALAGLRRHRHESASFTLVGTNANGTARATARIKVLSSLK